MRDSLPLRPRSTHELADIVRAAHEDERALRVVGRGAWQDGGLPVRASARRLETAALTGIVDYVPGDLTLTARAGTTIAEIDAATAPHRQWCPLAPRGGDEVTLGAVCATATSGPFAATMGRPRDLVIGLEFVDGTGDIARGGGRVVKNVAGFDLTRLLIGSWGALGVITEVSVRLRALPRADETWAVGVDWGDDTVSATLDALARGPLAPMALVRLEGGDADALGLSLSRCVLARIGGNGSLVAGARAALRAIGPTMACDPSLWRAYRERARPRPFALAPSMSTPVARRVKDRFDPRGILNPGILGERRS